MKQKLAQDYPEVKKNGIPQMDFGLGRLQWDKASEIIRQDFEKTDYNQCGCHQRKWTDWPSGLTRRD